MLRKACAQTTVYAIIILCGIGVAQADLVYNLTSDWSINNGNPNGAWTYGECPSVLNEGVWTPTLDGFTPYVGTTTVASGPFTGVTRWDPAGTVNRFIGYNPSGDTLQNTGNNKTWTPYTVAIAPNAATDAYVIVWTAPEAGTIELSSNFFDLQHTNNALIPMVYLNTTQLWSNEGAALPHGPGLGTPGATVAYASTVDVAAGDKLYFLATGGNAHTGIDATVTYVPEPASIALLATGLLGLLAYAWRKRK